MYFGLPIVWVSLSPVCRAWGRRRFFETMALACGKTVSGSICKPRHSFSSCINQSIQTTYIHTELPH